jgi:hypothetical protein
MRRVFLSAAIILFASNAWAGTSCVQVGNQVRCSESIGVPSIGGTTCHQIGNQVRCN